MFKSKGVKNRIKALQHKRVSTGFEDRRMGFEVGHEAGGTRKVGSVLDSLTLQRDIRQNEGLVLVDGGGKVVHKTNPKGSFRTKVVAAAIVKLLTSGDTNLHTRSGQRVREGGWKAKAASGDAGQGTETLPQSCGTGPGYGHGGDGLPIGEQGRPRGCELHGEVKGKTLMVRGRLQGPRGERGNKGICNVNTTLGELMNTGHTDQKRGGPGDKVHRGCVKGIV
jgi:hypothetical protein